MLKDSSIQQGFTLVELVLTMIILGVIAVVSLPKFFNQSTFDERYFYDDLISAARYAQRIAIGSGCAVRLSVSSSGYALNQDINCNLSSPSYTLTVIRPSDSEAFSNNNVPSNLTISSSNTAYFFLPQGGAVDSGGVSVGNATVTLNSSDLTDRTINIEGATGYVY
jgi:MSHA pilin protein MshC